MDCSIVDNLGFLNTIFIMISNSIIKKNHFIFSPMSHDVRPLCSYGKYIMSVVGILILLYLNVIYKDEYNSYIRIDVHCLQRKFVV